MRTPCSIGPSPWDMPVLGTAIGGESLPVPPSLVETAYRLERIARMVADYRRENSLRAQEYPFPLRVASSMQVEPVNEWIRWLRNEWNEMGCPGLNASQLQM